MDEFGTMEDLKELITQMHARDMKITLDLVPNHTSTAHKWFQESRKDHPYSDFYYWYDEPHNDWKSVFRGSAWEYDEMRGQYDLHSYAISQADLNWNNPAVVKAMQDVVDFGVDMGVDGFRIDVIDQISKDMDGIIYPGGGFSTSDKPWIAYHSRMQEVNLENDLAAERSVFRFYQALLKLPFECGASELSNLSRQQANGVYQPYECAVCRVLN